MFRLVEYLVARVACEGLGLAGTLHLPMTNDELASPEPVA